jgi:hypothetical protein
MQPKKRGENHRTAGRYSFPDIGHLIKQLISLSFRRSWRARHSSSSKTFCDTHIMAVEPLWRWLREDVIYHLPRLRI